MAATGKCDCWVSRADDLTRFSIHWGAHSLNCPEYQRSLDSVDQLNDVEAREHGEDIWGQP